MQVMRDRSRLEMNVNKSDKYRENQMKSKVEQILSIVVLMLFLVGCSTSMAENKTPPTATPIPAQKVADPTMEPGGDEQAVVDRAVADLKGRLGEDAAIVVQEVIPTDFSDASLGMPEPGKVYAQALTPGYVVRLAVGDQVYIYHGSGDRVVLAAQETQKVIAVPGDSLPSVSIEGVQVTPEAIVVTGRSTWPDGTSIQAELLAGDQGAIWWPESAYAVVQEGVWQITVPLDGVALDREVAYTVYAWAESDASNRAAFPFDLAGPPTPTPAGDWLVLDDPTYGFRLSYPQDWMAKDLDVRGPGVPDDWPVMRMVLLYPQAWDAQINRSGPPDPNAKVVVAPLQIEVLVGSAEQFRRVYPEPAESETVKINGLAVTVEKERFGAMTMTRYVFVHPDNPEVYVVVSDQITGFPDRVLGNEAIVEWVPQIVQTFTMDTSAP